MKAFLRCLGYLCVDQTFANSARMAAMMLL